MTKAIIALSICITLLSCANQSEPKSTATATPAARQDVVQASTNTIELLYIHGKQRCITCKSIEDETANFVKEFANKRVVMKAVDSSTSEGAKIAAKYQATGSALILVKDDFVMNLTSLGFRYARNKPTEFKNALKEIVENNL